MYAKNLIMDIFNILKWDVDANNRIPQILVDNTTCFQKIDGFGASFNEAGMICLNLK